MRNYNVDPRLAVLSNWPTQAQPGLLGGLGLGLYKAGEQMAETEKEERKAQGLLAAKKYEAVSEFGKEQYKAEEARKLEEIKNKNLKDIKILESELNIWAERGKPANLTPGTTRIYPGFTSSITGEKYQPVTMQGQPVVQTGAPGSTPYAVLPKEGGGVDIVTGKKFPETPPTGKLPDLPDFNKFEANYNKKLQDWGENWTKAFNEINRIPNAAEQMEAKKSWLRMNPMPKREPIVENELTLARGALEGAKLVILDKRSSEEQKRRAAERSRTILDHIQNKMFLNPKDPSLYLPTVPGVNGSSVEELNQQRAAAEKAKADLEAQQAEAEKKKPWGLPSTPPSEAATPNPWDWLQWGAPGA